MQIEHLDKPTTETQIAAFEHKLKIHLPRDYREFLLAHNVCKPIPNVCKLGHGEGEDEVRYFLGFSESSYFSLEESVEAYKSSELPRLPSETLPIGEDSFGNLFCIVTQGENCGSIYFWDHDWENEGKPDYTNMHHLADSFTEFLNQLHESEFDSSS